MSDIKQTKTWRNRESSGSPAKKKQMTEKTDQKSATNAATGVAISPSSSPPGPPGGESAPEAHEKPPAWFVQFEVRQNAKFDMIISECREQHKSLKYDLDNMKDEVAKLSKALEHAEIQIDDLENRSRRNNIVLYNVPEKMEGPDCAQFVLKLVATARGHGAEGGIPAVIQRAHRSGRLVEATTSSGVKARPRPIHVGFSSYLEKEKCRKVLLEFFKKEKFGPQEVRLFVSDDYSQKVRRLRKEKLPELVRLRKEGKQAFFVYPATIRVRSSHPGSSQNSMDQ